MQAKSIVRNLKISFCLFILTIKVKSIHQIGYNNVNELAYQKRKITGYKSLESSKFSIC